MMETETTLTTTSPHADPANKYAGRADELLDAAQRCEIVDDATFGRTADLLTMLKEAIKRIDEERVEMTKPILESKANIDAKFKTLTGRLTDAVTIIESKVYAYHDRTGAGISGKVIRGDVGTLQIQYREPKVVVDNIDEVPDEFIDVVRVVNVARCLEALDDMNETIPGITFVKNRSVVSR